VRAPQDDLLTRLLTVEEDSHRLDPAKLGSFVTQMIIAGNATTCRLRGHLRRQRDDGGPSAD
jgi:cytochrome P450